MVEGVNLRYNVSTYANVTVYSPVQLLYPNKNTIKKRDENLKLLEDT
jgi:hypothetical protein